MKMLPTVGRTLRRYKK